MSGHNAFHCHRAYYNLVYYSMLAFGVSADLAYSDFVVELVGLHGKGVGKSVQRRNVGTHLFDSGPVSDLAEGGQRHHVSLNYSVHSFSDVRYCRIDAYNEEGGGVV